MVIRPDEGTLRLTTQPEHARLAGQLAEAWGGGGFTAAEPLGPIQLAAELHDAGWVEVDAEPRANPDTGRPYSFLDIPQNVHVMAHTATVEYARQTHPYAGLLTSLHSAGLYRERYGYLPHIRFRRVEPAYQQQVDRFLAEQDQVQTELMAMLRPDPAVLWTHYRWFQLWDMLSLYACMLNPTVTGEQLLGDMPLSPGGDIVTLRLFGAGEGCFVVDPWPFRPAAITLHWQSRILPDRPYESDAELRLTFAETPLQPQTITLLPR